MPGIKWQHFKDFLRKIECLSFALLLPLMVEGFRYRRGKFKTAKVLRSSEVQRWEPCYHLTLSHNGTSNHPEVNISILYWQCSAVFTSCTRSLASVHRAGGGHWKHWTLCIVLWMERRSWNIGSPDQQQISSPSSHSLLGKIEDYEDGNMDVSVSYFKTLKSW